MSLDRFLQAQETHGSYERALAELRAGQKASHWMWWVFPQLRGLGKSHNSTYYGLADEDEAREFLAHPVLGVRYRECVAVVHGRLCEESGAALTLMGSEVDVLKLRSSLELFLMVAAPSEEAFREQVTGILPKLG